MELDLAPPRDGVGSPQVLTLIDLFLREQADTTVVERFARQQVTAAAEPLQARYYRDLIPATPPGPGQQYAFEVDLDACTGCKACVTACHSLNGLDEGEAWRSVGLLAGGSELPVYQHVTTACHHCAEPGCMDGCPVQAYEKDPDTGIVRHLDDQCIGCGYCIFTCAYEVPQMDRARGIVRKCDMCHDRLAAGEAPACVQGCPTQAIRIAIVDLDDVAGPGDAWPFPAPDPVHSRPSTVYRTQRDLTTGVEPADLHALQPRHAHHPLAVMLVLTQVAVGTHVVDVLAGTARGGTGGSPAAGAVLALVTALVALGASLLHLGRPQYAWRAVLGLRRSWISREIVAFAGFAGLTTLDATARLGIVAVPGTPGALAATASSVGLAGVACSVMIYAVTHRRWWRLRWTGPRFALTTLLGGSSAVLATLAVVGAAGGAGGDLGVMRALALAVTAATAGKLAVDLGVLLAARGPATSEIARTARLLRGALRVSTRWRVILAVAGGMVAPHWALALAGGHVRQPLEAALVAGLALALVVAGELVERWQFFTAVAPVRMPGSR
ncbi:MAG TPA: DmsC/YnfH family molybdoenzyme membrane anchor subunit [Nitriliruptorales bacterium]